MQALNREPGQTDGTPTAHLYRELTGTHHLNDVVLVDQSPIGRTPRSNPVTYIKAFDDIRALFAAQPDAKRKGFAAGSFLPTSNCLAKNAMPHVTNLPFSRSNTRAATSTTFST